MLLAQLVSANYLDYEISSHNRVGMAPNKSSRVMLLKWVASEVSAIPYCDRNTRNKEFVYRKHCYVNHIAQGMQSDCIKLYTIRQYSTNFKAQKSNDVPKRYHLMHVCYVSSWQYHQIYMIEYTNSKCQFLMLNNKCWVKILHDLIVKVFRLSKISYHL